MNVDAMSGDTSRLWPRRAVKGAVLGFPPGAICAAITGACWGVLLGLTPLFWYVGWFVGCILCVLLYTPLGALLGMFVGAIVGAAGAVARSAVAGAIVGGGLALVIGWLLVVGAWTAAGEPAGVPIEPINPGATAEEEQQLKQDYAAHQVQNVNNDQWLLLFGIVPPAVLCILLATLGAAVRLGYRRSVWADHVANADDGPTGQQALRV